MSYKSHKTYICQSCDHESPRWSGRCPQCGQWNTLVETVVSTKISNIKYQISNPQLKSQSLDDVEISASKRISTGISEFDRVLGGGIVAGSVILLAGEPGIGKSTLLLQVAASAGALYVSGEESGSQLKLRADRLGIKADNIQILPETDVDVLISSLAPKSPKELKLLIIDSVQTLTTSAPPFAKASGGVGAGSISQVRECSRRLSLWAKQVGKPLILVGHVTKEGSIAGPKVLEHMVDVVLYLEGDKFHSFRLLRAKKNRFGSDQEVGVFAMGDKGLAEIQNPSDVFLAERAQNASGSVVTVTMEGTRPVLVEIQALATNSSLAYPRRTASGLGLNRLNLLIAVLQKHLKLPLQNKDVYVNVAGGFKITEPAADLAVALAIVSSVKDKPIDPSTCVFGEVGLSGEVRKVSQSERRVKEARKLGFSKIISPESARSLKEALNQST